VLGQHATIDVLMDVRALLVELVSPRDECLVLDPALITPAIAQSVAANATEFPRAIVAYSSVTTEALESSVILAQHTPARFVFRGTPNERAALEQALFLTPDSTLGTELMGLLESNLDRLPSGLRDRLTMMIRNGNGPNTPDAFAAAGAVARRSLDRNLAEAGFVSARRVIEGIRLTSAYRAITTSRTSFGHIAMMLGYRSQRTLDAQLVLMLGLTASKLRADPLSCAEAARRLTLRLTTRDGATIRKRAKPSKVGMDNGERTLQLVGGNGGKGGKTDVQPPQDNASGSK